MNDVPQQASANPFSLSQRQAGMIQGNSPMATISTPPAPSDGISTATTRIFEKAVAIYKGTVVACNQLGLNASEIKELGPTNTVRQSLDSIEYLLANIAENCGTIYQHLNG